MEFAERQILEPLGGAMSAPWLPRSRVEGQVPMAVLTAPQMASAPVVAPLMAMPRPSPCFAKMPHSTVAQRPISRADLEPWRPSGDAFSHVDTSGESSIKSIDAVTMISS